MTPEAPLDSELYDIEHNALDPLIFPAGLALACLIGAILVIGAILL